MNQPFYTSSFIFSVLFTCSLGGPQPFVKKSPVTFAGTGINKIPKIQIAILLDVSNSMDGLIEQAKTQLWNMVKIAAGVKCESGSPGIEIALYEYGRSTNDSRQGYIKQIRGFTNDLDKLYLDLRQLTTKGGDEYCGHVISSATNELDWDNSPDSYKVIFIAGNEPFTQGDISYTEACKKAKEKGVIVNTIFCGSREQGVLEQWNLGAECGDGSFTNIDQNAKDPEIATPYDSSLFVLNEKLNQTYIPYGYNGKGHLAQMLQFDTVATDDVKDINKIVGYMVVRSDKNLYNRSAWDLVDAAGKDSAITQKIDMKTLPDSLRNKTTTELKKIIENKAAERAFIRQQIAVTNQQRDIFIATEKARSGSIAPQTLETQIEKIMKAQVQRFHMKTE